MNNSFPTIIDKTTNLSSLELLKYFNLGYKECSTLWDSDVKLNTQSILTILSFDSSKHLLGEKDTHEKWIAFKTGAIAQLKNIGENKSKIATHYTFIEKSDDFIALIELEMSTFHKFFQKEYPDLVEPKLYYQRDLELFFKQICINISLSSFIPKKSFTKYLQIFH